MLARRNALPEQYRRAIRLAIGISIPCVFGLGVLGTELPRDRDFTQACLWCAITMAVVNAPLLGKAATTGMERALGTILGGFTGYLVFQIGELFWNEQTDGTVLTVGACVVAFSAILAGHWLKLDTSARLFIITFLLVIFGADRGSDAGHLAWNRVCGILAGVALILILSILVFPKSASVECIRNVEQALESLKELNGLAWQSYILGPELATSDPIVPDPWRKGSGYAAIPGIDVEAQIPGRAEAAAARAIAEDAFEMKVEKVVTSVYQSCFKLLDNMVLADAEWYLGSYGGSPIFVPDLPLCLATKTSMPLEDLAEVGVGIRRVARLLSQLINTLGYGFRAELQEMLGDQFPDEMMRKLGLSCQAVTQEMTRAFPYSPAIMPGPLVSFVSTVASLVSTSDMQRRQIIRALKKYRTQRPDRLGWERLVDAMLFHRSPRQPGDGKEEGQGATVPIVHSAPAHVSPLMRAIRREASVTGPTPALAGPDDAASATRTADAGESGLISAPLPAVAEEGRGSSKGKRPPLPSKGPKAAGGEEERAGEEEKEEEAAVEARGGSLQLAESGAEATQQSSGAGTAFGPPSRVGWSRSGSARVEEGEEGVERDASSLLFSLSLPRSREVESATASGGGGGLKAPLLPGGAARSGSSGGGGGVGPHPGSGTNSPRFADWARGKLGSLNERIPSSRMSNAPSSSAAEASVIGRSALRAAAAAECSPGLAALLGPVTGLEDRGKGPTARQLAALGAGTADPRLHVFLFPETPEGRVAQVRWYSFQYLLEEVTEELSALQHALNDTLAKMP